MKECKNNDQLQDFLDIWKILYIFLFQKENIEQNFKENWDMRTRCIYPLTYVLKN